MMSRNVGSLPAHGAPSREDFLKLDARQQEQINDVFNVFDIRKSGRQDYQEFRFCLRALGFELPKSETYPYLARYGIPPVDWDPKRGPCSPPWLEFTLPIWQGIAGTLVYNRDPRQEVSRAFKLFDISNSGLITQEDLRRVMNEIGQSMDESELAAMIDEFDTEGRGGVNEAEFEKIMLSRKQK